MSNTNDMTATATVKMPRIHFHRTFNALEETRRMIGKIIDEKLVADYKLHEKALLALLEVAEPVDNTTGAEGIKMASAVHAYMNEFKANQK